MTPPQEVSAAPAPDALNRASGHVCDVDELKSRLNAAFASAENTQAARSALVGLLRKVNADGREKIARAFRAYPLDSGGAIRSYSHLTDALVETTFWAATTHLYPNAVPTTGERLSVLAVGGYGRGEMAPYSDVDLLFLTPYKITPWCESIIEQMLYVLWDLRLKVGHASRTIKDCLRLGRADHTIRTALLEHRFLTGDGALAEELNTRLWKELFRSTATDFIEAKLEERAERHKRQGRQRYLLEPNVKEGKGGLRDLQSLFWIAKYVYHVEDARDLIGKRVFRQEEYDAFQNADRFLWAVRSHMHAIADRAADQLTFDMQVQVADRMGYADHGGRRAVEHFMQDYFRHASRVGELTRILLTDLEAAHVKKAPALVGLLRRRKKIRSGYTILQNRLSFENEEAFLADPLNLLRIFAEALRTGYLLHPNAMRMISANLHLIDDDLRQNREARKIFLDLLLRHGNPERTLRRMKELGVLAAFIPEFEPIVAMMQFNVYHSYTVDEHIIQCISILAQIERGELVEKLPIASGILKEGVDRKILYVALLLHDIGKGRDGDHSVLGARMARKIAVRLGLNAEACETVEWLVRYHLLMSDMAQKRDIADPRTVRDFSKAVTDKKRLDLLTVLTVCDIRGVGPNVWNNWKAVLLRSLYHATADILQNGPEAISRPVVETEAKRKLRQALSDWEAKTLKTEITRHYSPYWQGLQTPTHVVFARMLRDLPENEIRIDLKPDFDRDATRACFAMVDHPGIFSRFAGALALVGANVVDARTYTSKDGFATAVFWIQDADGAPYEQALLERLASMIRRTLAGAIIASDALADRDKLKKRERQFVVPTNIAFDNEGSEIYTIIEVDTRDRPGLLYDLTRTLAANNVYIASAQIATYGAQVVDTFYVKDMFGLKFHSEAKRKALERKLRTAIEQGAERARS
ncbi:MAG: [protein-PII] uridylyltransferase [Pseudomonadota bacterium]